MAGKSNHRSLLIGAVLLLSSMLLIYRPSYVNAWWQTLFDWMHVPVFGLIALAFLGLTSSVRPAWWRFGIAMLGGIALAFATEAAQIPLERNASVEDVVSDIAGVAAFLLAAASIRCRLPVMGAGLIASLAIVYWSALPLIELTSAYVDRNKRFPVIFTPVSESADQFFRRKNAHGETQWDDSLGRAYERLVFPAASSPSVYLHELFPDWSGYQALEILAAVEGDSRMAVTIRIHDQAHLRGDQPHEDRFNRNISLEPGLNIVAIPLDDIERAPVGRSMDMTRIEMLVLFSAAAETERSMRLYELRLE